MSFEMFFLKRTDACPVSAEEAVRRLLQDEDVPGCDLLPLDELRQAMHRRFDLLEGDNTELAWEGKRGAFQVRWSIPPKLAVVTVHGACGCLTVGRIEKIFRSLGFRIVFYDR